MYHLMVPRCAHKAVLRSEISMDHLMVCGSVQTAVLPSEILMDYFVVPSDMQTAVFHPARDKITNTVQTRHWYQI